MSKPEEGANQTKRRGERERRTSVTGSRVFVLFLHQGSLFSFQKGMKNPAKCFFPIPETQVNSGTPVMAENYRVYKGLQQLPSTKNNSSIHKYNNTTGSKNLSPSHTNTNGAPIW
ncbi:hypothetical protein M5D96_012436, partial [Drosophila gunungcola]